MRARKETFGFTLVELLLVLAIIGVVTAVTVPSLTKSLRGHRLRTAARTVVMAGRYARSMAVLRQERIAITFDLTQGVVLVQGASRRAASAAGESAPETGSDISSDLRDRFALEAGAEGATNATASYSPLEVKRPLDGVKIASVQIGDNEQTHAEGICSVYYSSHGRCTPYTVTLADEQGDAMTIEVDALASAETRTEMAK